MKVEDFVYDLPDRAIAQSAVEPRDSSRLLDSRDMTDHVFADLPNLLLPGDLVVVNETKVRRARLAAEKDGTGGAVELLVLGMRIDGRWEAMIRPARRIRAGTRLWVNGTRVDVVDGPDDGLVVLEVGDAEFESVMEESGSIPLPPYFRGSLEDDDRYQTMFAAIPGSAAAPTAGLHFTTRVLDGFRARSIELARVDLHVGVDTFRPVTADRLEDHVIHREWCSVPKETSAAVAAARERGGRVVAIGTTSVRALETFAAPGGLVRTGSVETDLFLHPGSEFRVVDLLVTNFHVPGSTLVAMVAGFMGVRWRAAYTHALDHGYRFLSFGDAMLCERMTPG
jgi:S-adenosylmethionine:tRNA ribosyltransferase-isomerase